MIISKRQRNGVKLQILNQTIHRVNKHLRTGLDEDNDKNEKNCFVLEI